MNPYRLREEMNGIDDPQGKVWFWDLASSVIDADRCIQCGTCVAVCPSNSIGVRAATGMPELIKMCTGCSLCWDYCPRGGLRYEALSPAPAPALAVVPEYQETQHEDGRHEAGRHEAGRHEAGRHEPSERTRAEATLTESTMAETSLAAVELAGDALTEDRLGEVALAEAKLAEVTREEPLRGRELGPVVTHAAVRAAKRTSGVQDGGAVTAMLCALLESGEINGALVTVPSADPLEPKKGVAKVATTREEILAAAGSFYNQTMALAALDLTTCKLPANPRLVVVGTSCVVQGVRAMQVRRWRTGAHRVDAVTLTIALMCSKNFDYDALMRRELRDRRGVDLDRVAKVDVVYGRLLVEYADGEVAVDEPIKAFHGAGLTGCDECADFSGQAADISVGSVGSIDGWTSVLVRTPRGRRAFDVARRALDVKALDDLDALVRLSRADAKRAARSLQRPLDPTGELFIEHAEHVERYTGTSRQPVVLRR